MTTPTTREIMDALAWLVGCSDPRGGTWRSRAGARVRAVAFDVAVVLALFAMAAKLGVLPGLEDL